ncbi:MAG: dihydrofolate reductase family protein [Methanothrix sp.]|nr:dihydrofolate reductase family protein [Methanothrix sp.]
MPAPIPFSRPRAKPLPKMRAPFSRQRSIRATVVPCRPFPTAAGAYATKHYLRYIIAGQDHVDLCAALEELNSRYGVKVVRVDAGGTLNGQLLHQGLVAELEPSHPSQPGGR